MEAGCHGHIWRQAAITPRVSGQPARPMHMHRASPGDLAGLQEGRHMERVWGFIIVIFFFFTKTKEVKKKHGDKKRKFRDRIM